MAAPRVIGMLGGMSWESSAQYYRLVNELVRERLGGLHSARCLLASVDFADIEAMQVAGEWDAAGKVLAEAARGLEAGGAELLLLCTNTMHKVADQVQHAVRIPLLHIGDVAAKAVTDAGLRTVGLLGTAFTMEQDFYIDRLASHGLTVLVPDAGPRRRASHHLRRALPRRRARRITAAIPRGDRAPCAVGCGRHRARLYRDRTACLPEGQQRPGVSPPPCFMCKQPSTRRSPISKAKPPSRARTALVSASI